MNCCVILLTFCCALVNYQLTDGLFDDSSFFNQLNRRKNIFDGNFGVDIFESRNRDSFRENFFKDSSSQGTGVNSVTTTVPPFLIILNKKVSEETSVDQAETPDRQARPRPAAEVRPRTTESAKNQKPKTTTEYSTTTYKPTTTTEEPQWCKGSRDCDEGSCCIEQRFNSPIGYNGYCQSYGKEGDRCSTSSSRQNSFGIGNKDVQVDFCQCSAGLACSSKNNRGARCTVSKIKFGGLRGGLGSRFFGGGENKQQQGRKKDGNKLENPEAPADSGSN